MFKKPFKTKNSFVFRKSDRKRWIAKLKQYFGEEMIDSIIDPVIDVEVFSIANSRNIIYVQAKEPLFFDVSMCVQQQQFCLLSLYNI
jgi:predicted ribosome-associated RNA-binding protein Tma20